MSTWKKNIRKWKQGKNTWSHGKVKKKAQARGSTENNTQDIPQVGTHSTS